MSDEKEQLTIEIPAKVFPAELIQGIYANQIQQLSTEIETILDFSVLVPASYQTNQAGNLENVDISHQLVARIIVPRDRFLQFLASNVSRNPEIRAALAELEVSEGE